MVLMTTRQQMKFLDELSNKWTIHNPDAVKENWEVTLNDGTTFPMYCNIEMAIEIEEARIEIKAIAAE
jgi:hypothetical protein